jgi:vesicle coat complex subunit
MQEVKPDKVPTAHNAIYTTEFVQKELNGFLDTLNKNKKNFDYISWQDLIEDKDYSLQRISEWVRDFPSCSETKKKIDGILANKLSKLALANKVNNTMAIFCLKVNHKWRETDPDENQKLDLNISFGKD